MEFKRHKLYSLKDVNIAFLVWCVLFCVVFLFDVWRIKKYFNGGLPGFEIFLLVPWLFNIVGSIVIFLRLWACAKATTIPWGAIVTIILAIFFYLITGFDGFGGLFEFIVGAWPSFAYAILTYLLKVFYLRKLSPFSQEKYVENMLN